MVVRKHWRMLGSRVLWYIGTYYMPRRSSRAATAEGAQTSMLDGPPPHCITSTSSMGLELARMHMLCVGACVSGV